MQQGLRYHQSGNFEQAEICYEKSLAAQSDNYETLQLLGVLMHRLKRPKQAIERLLHSLSIKPNQANVLNSLGNAYKAIGQLSDAQLQYELALKIQPDYIDPYLNYFNLLLEDNRLEEIDVLLKKGRAYFSENPRFMLIEAKFAKQQQNYKSAIETLLRAISLAPNHIPLLHDLGLVYRLNGQSEKALEYYQKVEKLGHQSEAFYHNYANALSDLSASNIALEYYSKALQINPVARETLINWCDLMWESGQAVHMFSAYEKAVSGDDAPVEIYLDYVQKRLRVKQLESAREILHKMQHLFPSDAHSQVADIAIKREMKEYNFNETKLINALRESSLELQYKLDILEYWLEAGAVDKVYVQIKELMLKHPDDQLLLALLHTCSRLLPELSYPFSNLENYLFEYQIAPPDGRSLTSYLGELKDYLLELHSSKEQPLEQTLHKGTQTRGNLFDIEHPLLAHIQAQYKLAVNAYIEQKGHLPPLYPGFWQTKATEFSGSWSVALKQSGFHNHHVHPMGWLSSACYIALPQLTDSDNQGYFQVGIPNLANNGLGLPALKEVKPTPGKLVLFPSMLWHGTVPFEENSLRISIACDIIYSKSKAFL